MPLPPGLHASVIGLCVVYDKYIFINGWEVPTFMFRTLNFSHVMILHSDIFKVIEIELFKIKRKSVKMTQLFVCRWMFGLFYFTILVV